MHHSRRLACTVVVHLALFASVLAAPAVTAQDNANEPIQLGVVLYPGWEPLDVFGPLEMFMNVGSDQLRIHMLAEKAGPVPSSAGRYPESLAPKVIADTALADAPKLDIILVPGGFGTLQALQNEVLLDWLRERAPETRYMTSVCSGSAILGKAGLLDGVQATGTKQLFGFVAAQGPKADWQEEARWVEDGKFITSSGVSAGIDMSLALIAKLFGEGDGGGDRQRNRVRVAPGPDDRSFLQVPQRGYGCVGTDAGELRDVRAAGSVAEREGHSELGLRRGGRARQRLVRKSEPHLQLAHRRARARRLPGQ